MYIYLKGIELIDKVTENLKDAKKTFFRLYEPYNNQPLSTDDYSMISPYRSYETDGKLLLVKTVSDLRDRLVGWGGVFWIMAAIAFLVSFLDDGTDLFSYIALSLFLTGLVLWLTGRPLKSTGYFVFNRTSGTVLFPAKWRCPPLIVRLEDVRCHPSIYVLQYGGVHRTHYLWANKVTNSETRRQKELYIDVSSKAHGQFEWSLICTFMDQSQPVPDIPAFSERSNYYKKHNLSLQEVFSKPVHEDFLLAHIVEEFEESQK